MVDSWVVSVAAESVTAVLEWAWVGGAWEFSVVVAAGVVGLTWWWLHG